MRWFRPSRRQTPDCDKATRLSFFAVPNGIIMDRWTPAAIGKGYPITPVLEPLAAFKDRMVVLERSCEQRSPQARIRNRGRSPARVQRLSHGGPSEDDVRRGYSLRRLGRSDRGEGTWQTHAAAVARNRVWRRRWWARANPPTAVCTTTRSRGVDRRRRCRWKTAPAPCSNA